MLTHIHEGKQHYISALEQHMYSSIQTANWSKKSIPFNQFFMKQVDLLKWCNEININKSTMDGYGSLLFWSEFSSVDFIYCL